MEIEICNPEIMKNKIHSFVGGWNCWEFENGGLWWLIQGEARRPLLKWDI